MSRKTSPRRSAHRALALAASAAMIFCVAGAEPAAAQLRPSGIFQAGLTYDVETIQAATPMTITVIEIGPTPWLKVKSSRNGSPFWLNSSFLLTVKERSPAVEAAMDSKAATDSLMIASLTYKTQMIYDLTSLRTAEETFFVDSTRYGALAELKGKFSSTSGVNAPRVEFNRGSWSATVTHPKLPGLVCGIAVAKPNPVNPRAGEGEPVCK